MTYIQEIPVPADAVYSSIKEGKEWLDKMSIYTHTKAKYLVSKENLETLARKFRLTYVYADVLPEDAWFIASADWEVIYFSGGA